MASVLSSCWNGVLNPDNCCWPPIGNPMCFPDYDLVHTYAACCRSDSQFGSIVSASRASDDWTRAVVKDDGSDNDDDRLDTIDVTVEPCACHHPSGKTWFRRSWHLDVKNRGAVKEFCKAGLHEAGLSGMTLHTAEHNQKVGQADCPAAFVILFAMCALAEAKNSKGTSLFQLSLDLLTEALYMAKLVTHCLDRSNWPMTIAELTENYLLFLEQGKNFNWLRPDRGLQYIPGVWGYTMHESPPLGGAPVVNHMELQLRLNWVVGIWDTLEYWRNKMSSKSWAMLGPHKLSHIDLCTILPSDWRWKVRRVAAVPSFRVLHVGSGPSAGPSKMKCGRRHGEVLACDALARHYRRLAQETHVEPYGGFPMFCDVDELWRHFPENYFDIAYSSNALDHTVHPLRGIRMIVRSLRVGGVLLLWHLQNVHPEQWTMMADGQHQWGFDVANTSSDGFGNFVIWNFGHHWDVSRELTDEGHTVEARLDLARGPTFVEVKIVKGSQSASE